MKESTQRSFVEYEHLTIPKVVDLHGPGDPLHGLVQRDVEPARHRFVEPQVRLRYLQTRSASIMDYKNKLNFFFYRQKCRHFLIFAINVRGCDLEQLRVPLLPREQLHC